MASDYDELVQQREVLLQELGDTEASLTAQTDQLEAFRSELIEIASRRRGIRALTIDLATRQRRAYVEGAMERMRASIEVAEGRIGALQRNIEDIDYELARLSEAPPDPEPDDPRPAVNVAVDIGIALLEPVTVDELRSIEVILAQLQRAVEGDQLGPLQEQQVIAMAHMIRSRQRAVTPDETPRHEIVGPTRGALLYLSDLPQGAVAWGIIIDTLTKVHWHELARMLPGGPS